jgi:hypothetical protein
MLAVFTIISALLVAVHSYQISNGKVRSSAIFAKSKSVPFLDAPKNLDGMVGDKGFDPIGFSDIIDPRFLREAELKHCRLAMLGTLGFIATEFVKLPDHAVSPIEAHNVAVASGAMAQILTLVVALEFVSVVAVKEMLDSSGRQPGEYSFDPLGFSAGKSDKIKADYALKELENGRLAMLAFGGIVTQAVVTGKGFPYF